MTDTKARDKEWTNLIIKATGKLNSKDRAAVIKKLQVLGKLLIGECSKDKAVRVVDDEKLKEYSGIIIETAGRDTGNGGTIIATLDQIELVVKDEIAKKEKPE